MKKLIFLLFIPLVFTCSSDSSDDNTNNVDDTNPVYLAENGVTIKARDWALIGDSGVVNGIGYTIVDVSTLETMIQNGDDVSRVCTSRILNMANIFYDDGQEENFNQNISSWDVGNVTNMDSMFRGLVSFNQDLSSWDVGNVTNMDYMFYRAAEFNSDLSSWNVDNVTECYFFCYNTFSWDLPQPNFTNCSDETLCPW